MAKRPKTTAFSFQGYDLDHYRTTDAYTRAVGNLFDRATNDIATGVAKLNIDPDKPFQFSDYPSAQATLKRVVNKLAKNMTAVVSEGSRKQWLYACHKNDEFISSIIDTSKLTRARLQKMQDRNLDALQTFQQRKVNGMNLSQRVWKYVGQFKDQIEQGLDVGLGDGRNAQQLSQDLEQNLKDPNRLYRRVRDKRGNLQLSKNAKAFHPGQGVYRSSHKNAMRLTRSEINMAYRESDWLRWQQLDFVIGFEVHRSNHEPRCKCDLCDKLVGRYPKTFKFKGWHPQCMCYATAILMDEDDYDAQELSDLKSALRGTEYKKLEVKNTVNDVPQGFKDWVAANQEAQADWGSTPYFIKDNFKDGLLSKGLKPNIIQEETKVEHVNLADMPEEQVQMWRKQWLDIEKEYNAIKNDLYTYKINEDTLFNMIGDALYETRNKSVYWRIDEAKAEIARLKKELAEAKMNRFNNLIKPYNDVIDKIRIDSRDWGLNTFPIDDAIAKQDAMGLIRGIKEMQSRIAAADSEYKTFINDATQAISYARKSKIDYSSLQDVITTIKSDKREWVMGKTSFKKELLELKKKIAAATGSGVPHPAMKTEYKTQKDVDDTLKIINSEFTTEKWFEHGDCQLTPTYKAGLNGFTYMNGKISLRPERLDKVRSAMAKIGKGESADITFDEADSMATFWHEITHNRNVPGNTWANVDRTSTQTDVMEMMNEFVARKTLPEFYAKMGCKETPHPEFINNRSSTGYNRRVVGYDFVIEKLGLDKDVVLQSARKNLFALKYNEQETTAVQALVDGGLGKYIGVNNKTIKTSQIKKIVALCRKGMSVETIENYMKKEGLI